MMKAHSTVASRLQAGLAGTGHFLAIPWAAFVGLFLYAVLLTLVAIAGEQLSDGFMAAAYGAPVAAYGVLLVARALRALAAMPIHFGHTLPGHALPR